MQTVWCFMNEDNADFDEALKSAIERRNFLLNRLFKKTPLGWIWRRKGRRGGSKTEGRTLNEKGCFTFWRNGRTCNFYFWFDKKKVEIWERRDHLHNLVMLYLGNRGAQVCAGSFVVLSEICVFQSCSCFFFLPKNLCFWILRDFNSLNTRNYTLLIWTVWTKNLNIFNSFQPPNAH